MVRSLLGPDMVIRHILVPVDFGEASAEALELSCELAKKLDAKLTLLHSFHVPHATYGYAPALWASEWLTASQAALQSLASDTRRRHPATDAVWLEGDPKLRIIEVAEQRSVDLIVAGTHGGRALSRALVGSVAGRLVRTSPVPLITTAAGPARASLRPRIHHVLVATDFGEPAQHACAIACDLASRFDARVTLVHVLPPALPQFGRPMPKEFLPVDAAKGALGAELERAKRSVLKVDGILAEGQPRDQIVRIASERKADMIAMGTHARRGVPRYLLGSVAEAVVRTSDVPVLTTTSETAGAR